MKDSPVPDLSGVAWEPPEESPETRLHRMMKAHLPPDVALEIDELVDEVANQRGAAMIWQLLERLSGGRGPDSSAARLLRRAIDGSAGESLAEIAKQNGCSKANAGEQVKALEKRLKKKTP